MMELKDRELALRWWNRKSDKEKIEFAIKAKFKIDNKDLKTFTCNEIELIWRNQPYNS